MLRIHDGLSLTDTLNIKKSLGVVVIHFKGLKELQIQQKHWANMYNLSFTKLS